MHPGDGVDDEARRGPLARRFRHAGAKEPTEQARQLLWPHPRGAMVELEAAQRGGELLGAGVAIPRRWGHGLEQDPLQLPGHLGVDGRGRGDLRRLDLLQQRQIGLRREGALPQRGLEEHRAHREDVAALVHGLGPRLLRAHVAQLPLERAHGGDVAPVAGDAEVGQLDLAGGGDQHVGWRDVTVDQVEGAALLVGLAVGVVQGRADLHGDIDHRLQLQRALLRPRAVHARAQVTTVDVLHHDEVLVLVALPQVQDLHDVGVAQGGRDLGLADEHGVEAIVFAVAPADLLDHHRALEALHALDTPEEDLGHAPHGDALYDLVLAVHLLGSSATALWRSCPAS